MATGEIHVDDVGTLIEFTIRDQDGAIVNLQYVTTKTITFKPPGNATKFSRTPVFTTDGTDGKIKYVTVSGDINKAGEWKIQAFVAFASGEWYTDIQEFPVFGNL